MTTIEAYKTKDGQIFDDIKKALKHEAHITLSQEIKEFVTSIYFPGMTPGDLESIILEYHNRCIHKK